MERLSASDLEAVVDFLDELYRARDADAFSHWLVQALGALIGSNQTSWNRLMPTVPRAEVRSDPQLSAAEHRHVLEGFQRHLLEHPCVRHHLRTGSPRPVMISDFIDSVRFHNLGIYQEVYRLLEVEDQIGFSIGRYGSDTVAVAVSRDRRTFGERERALLACLRPHITRAWDNARVLSRWARHQLDDVSTEAAAQCVVSLDEHERPRELPSNAAHWLEAHFGEPRALARGVLPAAVLRWLRTQRPVASDPLVQCHHGYRLMIRRLLDPQTAGTTDVLLLERHRLAEAADHLRARGLTCREIQVLCILEQGLTNEEIAAHLHTSPLTVKKHLERIYRKLGVRNRTEAVAWLRATSRYRLRT